MAPFYDRGRRFRIKNELDEVLIQFVQGINLFDKMTDNLERLRKMARTKAFKIAFADLDYPDLWKRFRYPSEDSRVINPLETKKLLKKLKEILKQKNKRSWNKTAAQFLDNYFGEYCAAIDWICSALYKQSVIDLLDEIQKSVKLSERQQILINLVQLDIGFLTHPATNQIISESAFSESKEFRAFLARAIDSDSRDTKYKKERERYALYILSSLGYRQKSYKDWNDFFKYFNSQLGVKSGISENRHFINLESTDNLRKTLKKNKVPRITLPGGRKKSRSSK